ncbi:Vinorine synthase [Handroanthus impetiginosus]|uniref:Vinorine synthase n=1 Tax=Handroanthus impetiginosus TaxID=429701 RepID=A0A2G9H0M0_9LAMI|nr:Vinorine synthase [Handroanthus impetiginosus]
MEVISKEIIKPSCETPLHLRNLKLSYLDQLLPPIYIPFVFFYEADESRGLTCSNHVQICQELKNSLSKSLTSFYPLAGRIRDNFVIDCNDNGVEFVNARIHAHLTDVLKSESDPECLKQYIPLDPSAIDNPCEGALFAVQVTFFDCGGIAIGVCFSHRIADCTSIMAFVEAWAATTTGKTEVSQFSFDLANYFPPRDFSGFDPCRVRKSNDKITMRRFVFDKEKLAALRKAAISPSATTVKNPSRVELVSAFIWKHFIELSKHNGAKKNFAASHVVNLRTRTSPPQILGNVFGNSVMSVSAISESVQEYYELVRKLRRSIRTITEDYITESQSGDRYVNDLFNVVSSLMKGELEGCSFSSWSKLPFYEVDYGFGKPVWLGTTALPLRNIIILVNTRCGEGIEAWVNMKQDNLEMLEVQFKLISH